MNLCRNCEHWYSTFVWRGNCNKHQWIKDKYSQDAEPGDCRDYVDKYEKYKLASAKER